MMVLIQNVLLVTVNATLVTSKVAYNAQASELTLQLVNAHKDTSNLTH